MEKKRLSESLKEELFSFKSSKGLVEWQETLWRKLAEKGYDFEMSKTSVQLSNERHNSQISTGMEEQIKQQECRVLRVHFVFVTQREERKLVI